MKNPLTYLKHIVKDPIKTIDEANARKKEIMPLLYVSVGVIAISVILQTVAKLDFMSIFSLIGLIGVGFCGFLFMVINKAKSKFQALTCNSCNTMAEITTPEDFIKYVSYTVTENNAVFKGYTGNSKPNNGVYTQVKFSASSSAVLSVELTCPHCGEIKHLTYRAEPFKCHIEQKNVGVLAFPEIKNAMETAVKSVVNDYNDPEKRQSIPYTFHSSKNPNFEDRYKFKGANGANAHPDYMGVRIDYHKDAEEMLEHYFIFNEMSGSLIDPNGSSKPSGSKESKSASSPTGNNVEAEKSKVENSQNSSNTHQTYQNSSNKTTAETREYPKNNSESAKNTNNDISTPLTYKTEAIENDNVGAGETFNRKKSNQTIADASQKDKVHSEKQAPQRPIPKKSLIIVLIICIALIICGIIFGITMFKRNQTPDDATTQSSTSANENITTSDSLESFDINDYVGYWHMDSNNEKELTIHSGSSDGVSFSLWYAKKVEINNAPAQLKDNVATFSLAVDGSVIKGSLTFHKDSITVSITQSSLTDIPIEELEFTQLHMSSLVSIEEEPYDSSNANKDGTSNEFTEDLNLPLNETPYLFSVEENAFEIYEGPSYSSAYVQMLPEGTFTIVEEQYDENNNLWGKLKSGIGWICITTYTE